MLCDGGWWLLIARACTSQHAEARTQPDPPSGGGAEFSRVPSTHANPTLKTKLWSLDPNTQAVLTRSPTSASAHTRAQYDMPSKLPKHPVFGAALTREQFPRKGRYYQWYLAMCACIMATDIGQACKTVGISRHAFQTAARRMWQSGNLEGAPRASVPSVYTPEVLKYAYDTLMMAGHQLLNFTDLRMLMLAHGMLPAIKHWARFRQAFKQYCKKQGTPLTVNSHLTTFYLAKQDFPARAAYAEFMLAKLKKTGLENIVFVDEVVLEMCPHPKGAVQCMCDTPSWHA